MFAVLSVCLDLQKYGGKDGAVMVLWAEFCLMDHKVYCAELF